MTMIHADALAIAEQRSRLEASAARQERIRAEAVAEQERRASEAEERRRNPRPSRDKSRYSVMEGRATFSAGANMPPRWLIDAIPTLADLHRAWEDANADAARLRADLRTAQARLSALSSGSGEERVRRDGVSLEQYDEARAAVAKLEAAIRANGSRALRALQAFDDATYDRATSDTRRRVAASVAIEKHEAAVAAWSTLQEAIRERDLAHRFAGSPGRQWTTRNDLGALYRRVDGGLSDASRVFRAAVQGFDVAAVVAEVDR